MLKHAKVSAKADGADTSLILPSDWNADHTIDDNTIAAAKLAFAASSRLLGRTTAGAGAGEELTATQAKAILSIAAGDVSGLGTLATQNGTFSGTSSGTNTGDQTITLTGDVTGSGTGSFATTLATVPVTKGGTNATTARAAASNLALAYILGKSSVGVSCGADTSEDTLATVSIPSGAMGPNGFLLLYMKWTITNSANNKTLRARIDGTSGTAFFSRVFTTISSYDLVMKIANVNSNSVQLASGHGCDSATNGRMEANVSGAVNMASGSATSLVITGQKATSGEVLTLDSFLCLLCSDGT